MIGKKDAFVGNAADEEQVKKGGKKADIKRRSELADITHVMMTEQGRRFIYRVINDLCHYDADDAMPSGSFTYKSLGERNIGRILKSDCLESSIELYQKSEQENWEFLNKE